MTASEKIIFLINTSRKQDLLISTTCILKLSKSLKKSKKNKKIERKFSCYNRDQTRFFMMTVPSKLPSKLISMANQNMGIKKKSKKNSNTLPENPCNGIAAGLKLEIRKITPKTRNGISIATAPYQNVSQPALRFPSSCPRWTRITATMKAPMNQPKFEGNTRNAA